MHILVPIKRVIDYSVRVQFKRDLSGVQTDGVKMSINPFDEIAIEEALRIRESGNANEVIIASIGPDTIQQQMRTALAMGADRAVQIKTNLDVQPLFAAQLLRALVAREEIDLVIMGKQAIDDDCNQTGQMLAATWGRPQATFSSRVEIKGQVVSVTREVDEGLETIEVDLPAVITTDLRLNKPRFVKMPDIMKAKRKPLDIVTPDELKVTPPESLETVGYEPPPQRKGGHKVTSVDELVSDLRNRGVI